MKEGVFKNSDNTAYYKNNQLHREDGPAIEWDNGSKHWYFHGLLHRTDGPAIDLVAPYLGYTIKKWSINGKWHREDGPAVEWGTGYKEWWIDGQQLTEDQFNQWLKDQAVGETLSTCHCVILVSPDPRRTSIPNFRNCSTSLQQLG